MIKKIVLVIYSYIQIQQTAGRRREKQVDLNVKCGSEIVF
jgi:hypothetical protein